VFIFWGTKTVRSNLGFVADFCPLCRVPRPFRLARLGSASHIYGVSVGKGQLVGFERGCLRCSAVLGAEHENYREIAKNFPIEGVPESLQLSRLTESTFPDLSRRYARRLEIEEQIKLGTARIDAGERHSLIKEPFLLLAAFVEKEFAQTRIDGILLLTIFGAIGLSIGGYWMADQFLSGDQRALVPLVTAAAMAIALVAIIVQGYLTKNRYLHRKIYPIIGSALRPLRPQASEIATALKEVRHLGFALGKRTKPRMLEPYLQAIAG
jgi:hypothetical protein